MDQIKEAASNVANKIGGGAGEAVDSQTSAGNPGAFQKPKDFSNETQKGSVVGLQHEMVDANKPTTTQQEGDYGFESYKPAGKLMGKKALVTGGDSGIGRSVAVMYAMEGADVGIVYLPEEQKDAEDTQRLIIKYGQKALLIPQDIREEEGCKRIVSTFVSTFGQIDILVNNASVMYDCPSITDITTEQFDRTLRTNIYGTFFITRAAIPHIPKGGSIITTASQVAYAGPPSLVDYSMTKGAQVAMTRCLSNQLLSKGIRVNAVCPGPVWTPLQPAAMDKDTMKQWHSSPAPIGRIGQPSELGPAYVFLASQDGSFVSGQSIHVNGGAVVGG